MSSILDNGSHSWKPVGMAEQTVQILADPLNFTTSSTGVAFAYGVAVYLYLSCVIVLAEKYRTGAHRTWTVISLIYVSTSILTATVYCTMETWITKIAYVDGHYTTFYAGDPQIDSALYEKLASISETTSFIANWMNGGLLVYRLWDLYGAGSSSSLCVSGFALIVYLVVVLMGMVSLYEIPLFAQQQSFWLMLAPDFTKIHYDLMTFYALTTTIVVIARVLFVRMWCTTTISDERRGTHFHLNTIYISFIDSSALYAIWMVTFLVLYKRNDPRQIVFLGTMPEIQVVASLATIYSIALGKEWNIDTPKSQSSRDEVSGDRRLSVLDISGTSRPALDHLPSQKASSNA